MFLTDIFILIGIVAILAAVMETIIESNKINPKKFIIVGIICIIIATLTTGIIVVEPGQCAVTSVFGNVNDEPLLAGIHIVTPFITNVVLFDAKTLVDTQIASVLSSDALTIATDISINYRIDPSKSPVIYKTMGISYKDIVVDPTIRSVVRDVFATYDTKTIYSAGRSNLSNEIQKRLEDDLISRGIIIESVLLRSATPPESVTKSIEAKQQMEQEIQKKQFEVQKERAEADRKRAEAQGIADANVIISNSITPEYISWYTIDMLKNHHSDAMMYIPTGSDGLPMVSNLPLSSYVRPSATEATA